MQGQHANGEVQGVPNPDGGAYAVSIPETPNHRNTKVTIGNARVSHLHDWLLIFDIGCC